MGVDPVGIGPKRIWSCLPSRESKLNVLAQRASNSFNNLLGSLIEIWTQCLSIRSEVGIQNFHGVLPRKEP
jgi:hypothetical protein